MQLNIYSDVDLTRLLYSSNVVDLSSLTNPDIGSTPNWLGYVRFDFSQPNVNQHTTYYLALKLTNYTRNADTFFIASMLDAPVEVNNSNSTLPSYFEIYGRS